MSLEAEAYLETDVAEGSFFMEASLPEEESQTKGNSLGIRDFEADSISPTKKVKESSIDTRRLTVTTNSQNIPDHTPNKQSKVEVSRFSYQEITSNEYSTDNLVDSQKVSQHLNSGYESQFGSICHSYNNLYSVEANIAPVDRCSIASNYMYNSHHQPVTSTVVGPSYAAASDNQRYTDFSAYLNSQASESSQFLCGQIPETTGAFLDDASYRGRLHQTYLGSRLELSCDQGYGSHSTSGSYPEGDSQRDGSVMEQCSQYGQVADRGLSADSGSGDENYLHGENELEDLLYHFQNFFRNRFETELRNYQEAVYGILEEQQNHVRQIVHTALREQNSPSPRYTDDILEDTETKETSFPAKSENHSATASCSCLTSLDFYMPAVVSSNTVVNIQELKRNDESQRKMLELLSLSCSVSTLLAKSEFKS